MKLLGIEFGRVQDASGARGFFGEGYPFHEYLRPLGLDFTGSTFVAKTVTLNRRLGFMAFQENGITPFEWFPDCVKVSWRKRTVLNAVGLGNLGLSEMLKHGRWQEREEPFFLSFAAVSETHESRLRETVNFVRLLAAHRSEFRAPFGIQVNLSCPNSEHPPVNLIDEAVDMLGVLGYFLPGVPLVPKLSVVTSVAAAIRLAGHPRCSAVCVSNSLDWGSLPHLVPWGELYGTGGKSPLALYGGGGLSGAPLLEPVADWVRRARRNGLEKPIVAGGGILSVRDGKYMLRSGADAIALGSVAILRPWRVRKIIRRLG